MYHNSPTILYLTRTHLTRTHQNLSHQCLSDPTYHISPYRNLPQLISTVLTPPTITHPILPHQTGTYDILPEPNLPEQTCHTIADLISSDHIGLYPTRPATSTLLLSQHETFHCYRLSVVSNLLYHLKILPY